MSKNKPKYGKEQEGLSLFKIEKMVTVTDNWCPCYDDNKIRVFMFLTNTKEYKFVRIAAWGADDMGVELEYQGRDFDDLMNHYNFWKTYIYDKIPNGIDLSWFYEHGFYPA